MQAFEHALNASMPTCKLANKPLMLQDEPKKLKIQIRYFGFKGEISPYTRNIPERQGFQLLVVLR